MADPFIAQIVLFAGNFAPRGWAFCEGQLLPISQNTALFSLLGTTYGGDGRTTFGLPDLRGRVAIHPRTGPGLSTYRLGEKGGQETVILNTTQIPSHTHIVAPACNTTAQDDTNPQNRYPGLGDADVYANAPEAGKTMGATTSAATGGSQSHENRPPFLALNFIIATTGVFPSRN